MLVSVPLHLYSGVQALAPAAVQRSLHCAVGAFVEAAAIMVAVATFSFGLRT